MINIIYEIKEDANGCCQNRKCNYVILNLEIKNWNGNNTITIKYEKYFVV